MQVASTLDDTTRHLGGAPPLAPSSDPAAAVTASADALVAIVSTFGAGDWAEDRGGTTAIDVLRRGIADAGALVRQATRLTEPAD